MEAKPTAPATAVAMTRLAAPTPPGARRAARSSYSSLTPAPKTLGSDKRNENRAADSRVIPENSPPVIVVPERDAPGTSAPA